MLLIFCFNSLFGGEWLKFPMLLDHYREHREELQTTDFFDFLSQHYGNQEHESFHHRHEGKLPFKSGLAISLVYSMMAEIPMDILLPSRTLQPEISSLPFSIQSPYCHSILSSIWQPPKLS